MAAHVERDDAKPVGQRGKPARPGAAAGPEAMMKNDELLVVDPRRGEIMDRVLNLASGSGECGHNELKCCALDCDRVRTYLIIPRARVDVKTGFPPSVRQVHGDGRRLEPRPNEPRRVRAQ